ncbi:MAG: acetylxylan esterase [Planctomycetaceae bacterium]|nr:acetylxylan esterase [Planctomycetaceae bacterium]
MRLGPFIVGLLLASCESPTMAQPFPEPAALPQTTQLPDPLVMLKGQPVETSQQWRDERRPELKALFQHYMYGVPPPTPKNVSWKLERDDAHYFGGKATKKEVTVRFGPPQTPAIHLLLVIPNKRRGPAPCFVGLNFCGNHALVDDPAIPLPDVWMPDHCPGCRDGKAAEAGRGTQKDVWALEQSIDRGYAVATCYCGDIDPDKNDFTDGVHPHFGSRGSATRGPHDWGTIAAWAWGLSRCADYLVADKDLDPRRMIVVGHSRLGKTALLAGALDERFAIVIPHQAGCGGSAPNRKTGDALQKAESVKRINTAFPHWFCDEFKKFNDEVDRLPFDQHCLIALCAPRPVLLTNAVDDQWADPDGQFQMLQGADPVYRLLGSEGLDQKSRPELDMLISGPLGYFIHGGKHSMTPDDWRVFMNYADKQFAATP